SPEDARVERTPFPVAQRLWRPQERSAPILSLCRKWLLFLASFQHGFAGGEFGRLWRLRPFLADAKKRLRTFLDCFIVAKACPGFSTLERRNSWRRLAEPRQVLSPRIPLFEIPACFARAG